MRATLHRWTPALVMAVAVSVPGWVAWRLEADARGDLQSCLQAWADDVDRTMGRSRDLWQNIETQIRQGRQDRPAFEADMREYVAAVTRAAETGLRC